MSYYEIHETEMIKIWKALKHAFVMMNEDALIEEAANIIAQKYQLAGFDVKVRKELEEKE